MNSVRAHCGPAVRASKTVAVKASPTWSSSNSPSDVKGMSGVTRLTAGSRPDSQSSKNSVIGVKVLVVAQGVAGPQRHLGNLDEVIGPADAGLVEAIPDEPGLRGVDEGAGQR